MVDTGASYLVLPQSVVDKLGLPVIGKARVRYADQSRAVRQVVGYVHLALKGRDGLFKAIVEPKRKHALIGAIVLEDLDLLVDCRCGKVHPRDPKQYIAEIE